MRLLLAVSAILSGLLAGETFDRLMIGMPAWKSVPIQSWALYSLHADLSAGLIIYPVQAIGAALLLIGISIIVTRHKPVYNSIAIPIFIATALSILGLVLTAFAAPWMLRLKSFGNDQEVLQNIFDHFYFWSIWRGTAQIGCFLFCILGLMEVSFATTRAKV